MSPRMELVVLVCAVGCASLLACGSPETFHQRAGGGQSGQTATGGATGAAGVPGAAGDSPAGVAGSMGVAGDNATGVAGTTGVAGSPNAGTAGQTGVAGMAGTAGATGTAGGGAAGKPGTAGTMGTAGSGAAGKPGMAGTTGSAGAGAAGAGAAGAGAAGAGAAGTPGAGGTFGPGAVLRIDAGSATAQGPYLADEDFLNGTMISHSNTIDLGGVPMPAPEAVYQTSRQGAFTYTLPGYPAGSSHTIRLHWCETYFPPANDTMPGTGRRLCNVTVNGTMVLTSFDIFAAAGAKNKAVTSMFTQNASSTGELVLAFTPTKDSCFLAGLEIQ